MQKLDLLAVEAEERTTCVGLMMNPSALVETVDEACEGVREGKIVQLTFLNGALTLHPQADGSVRVDGAYFFSFSFESLAALKAEVWWGEGSPVLTDLPIAFRY
jgi:hypothetical protein